MSKHVHFSMPSSNSLSQNDGSTAGGGDSQAQQHLLGSSYYGTPTASSSSSSSSYPYNHDFSGYVNNDHYNVGPYSFICGYPDFDEKLFPVKPGSRDWDIFCRSLLCPCFMSEYLGDTFSWLHMNSADPDYDSLSMTAQSDAEKMVLQARRFYVIDGGEKGNDCNCFPGVRDTVLCFCPLFGALVDYNMFHKLQEGRAVKMSEAKLTVQWDRSLYHCVWSRCCFCPCLCDASKPCLDGLACSGYDDSVFRFMRIFVFCPCFLSQLILWPIFCYSCRNYQVARELDLRGKLRHSDFCGFPLTQSLRDVRLNLPSPFWIARRIIWVIRNKRAGKIKGAFFCYQIAYLTAKFLPHVDEVFYRKFITQDRTSWHKMVMITLRSKNENERSNQEEKETVEVISLSASPSLSEML